MTKDVDTIIQQVRKEIPSVQVVQMDKYNPADDDGIWWFRLPGVHQDVQIESTTGNCPFLVENNLSTFKIETIEEVVAAIVAYLKPLELD